MKIIELTIDNLDDFGGLDAISIVERPAHESNFLAFKDDYTPIYEMLGDEEMTNLAFQVSQLGEDHQQMLDDGYVLFSIQDAVEEKEKEVFFTPPSNPNPSNEQSFNPRVRYKYTGQIRENTREFCRVMVGANRIYTEDDITQLSALNPIGPSDYDVLRWRGSYNCLHKWVKLTYVPKNELENIRNNPASVRGLISQEEGVLFDTRNQKTIAAESAGTSKGVNIGPRVGGWFHQDFKVIDIIDEMPVFSTKEEALLLSERIGCKGFHTHNLDGGVVGYMACEKHEFESYDDYPKEASENACKVLRWIDEHGRDEVQGMTQTGLARANQLCKGENISEETIGRMAAFERHRKNSKINEEYKGTPWKDKGYVSWLGWGGDAGIEWAQRKLEQIVSDLSEEDMLDENPCQSGYVAYGTKMKNGKKVPNCIPENQSKFSFKTDDDKMEIIGPALIPNKMIIRRSAPTLQNPNGEFYYVFFNEETISKLSEKFMLEKRLDQTNIEHSDKDADSYVIESWIVSDPNNDKSNAYGMSYPKGTWMVSMRVKNKQIWNDIKSGKLNGYSVEGWFNENLLFQ